MIKQITVEDLEFARKLRNDNREHFFDSRKIDKETHLAWFNAMQKDPDMNFYIIWVCLDQVGTISAHVNWNAVEIGNIIIDKKHRRKGYLKIAMNELLKFYPTKQPFIKVIPSNKIAIKAYEAIGFKEKERTLWI